VSGPSLSNWTHVTNYFPPSLGEPPAFPGHGLLSLPTNLPISTSPEKTPNTSSEATFTCVEGPSDRNERFPEPVTDPPDVTSLGNSYLGDAITFSDDLFPPFFWADALDPDPTWSALSSPFPILSPDRFNFHAMKRPGDGEPDQTQPLKKHKGS